MYIRILKGEILKREGGGGGGKVIGKTPRTQNV